jgi:O-antigen/teichoic acid export membrane protein
VSDGQDQTQLRKAALASAGVMTLSLGVTMILGLAVKMYLPRALGAERLGLYYFAETFPALFFSLLPLGIGTYIQRTIPARHGHARDILASILIFETLFALLLGVVMVATLRVMEYDAKTIGVVIAMAVYFVLTVFGKGIFKTLYLAKERTRFVATLDVVVKVVQVVAVMAVLLTDPRLELVAAAFIASELLGVLVYLGLAYRSGDLTLRFDRVVLKNILWVSLPFFLTGVFSQIYTSVDATVLSKLANNVEVGLYGAASRLKGVFLMLVPIVQSALMPIMSRTLKLDPERYPPLARDVLRSVLVLSLPLTFGLMVFADDVSVLLYGQEFAPSGIIACYLAPVLTLTYVNVLLCMHLSLSTSGIGMAAVMLASIAINVVLNVWFIPWGLAHWPVGGAGVAVSLATLVSEAVAVVVLFALGSVRLWDRRLILTVVGAVVPCVFGIVYFEALMAVPLAWRIGAFVVVVPVYCLMTRMISVAEIRMLWSYLPRRRSV